MAFVRFHPLHSLQEELQRVFEHPLWRFDYGPSGRGVFPSVNVFGDKEHAIVRMEVPGVPPQDLSISAEGRTLTVTGKRELPAPENGSYHRRERSGGEFSRSIQLPDDLDLSRSEATVKNGMLTIRIPKREESKPRTISVKAA
jgi:HSP20 family protein